MSVELRFPNITAQNTEGQMAQMQSYMHQLVQQLNWALSTIDSAKQGDTSNIVINGGKKDIAPEEAENTFNSIKSLIIKSADIVKAYEETMKTSYRGEYIAVSDFGTYIEDTEKVVEENSKYTNEIYTNVQTITNAKGEGRLDTLEKDVKTTNAYIRRGLLEDGIYGIEVGETTKEGTFNKYARFTADKLSFYSINDKEVAYIGQTKNGAGCLYVLGRTVFEGDIQMGKYAVDTSDGLAFTWID